MRAGEPKARLVKATDNRWHVGLFSGVAERWTWVDLGTGKEVAARARAPFALAGLVAAEVERLSARVAELHATQQALVVFSQGLLDGSVKL